MTEAFKPGQSPIMRTMARSAGVVLLVGVLGSCASGDVQDESQGSAGELDAAANDYTEPADDSSALEQDQQSVNAENVANVPGSKDPPAKQDDAGSQVGAGGSTGKDEEAQVSADAGLVGGAGVTPVGQAPSIQIYHPGNGETRAPCPIEFPFIGNALDLEDGDLSASISWASDLDGVLGDGESFDACLSVGLHTVTASVTDSDSNTVAASITLNIVSEGEGDVDASAPTVSAGDGFERAALGTDWQVIFPSNSSQVQIIDGSDLGMTAGAQGFFLVNWVGSDFGPDQFCEGTLPADVDSGWIHQVYVRWRQSDGARYGFGFDGDPSQPDFGNWIIKYDGVPAAQTRIIASAPAQAIPGPGDSIRIEVEGYTLRGYLNGALVIQAQDEDLSRIASGRPGLAARWATGNQTTPEAVKVWESWSGGTL